MDFETKLIIFVFVTILFPLGRDDAVCLWFGLWKLIEWLLMIEFLATMLIDGV